MQELKIYLKEIQNIKESDKEHTFRGVLENLIKNIRDNLDFMSFFLKTH